MTKENLRRRIFILILFFIVALFLSGITAFPLESELAWLNDNSGIFPADMQRWIARVYEGIHVTGTQYPFLAYGTDWLAFAHIIIATAFIGPLRDPVKNKWVIDWGIISSVLVVPLALILGQVRGIPFMHQLIDCSFGIVGLIPLLIVRRDIKKLELINANINAEVNFS